MRRPTQLGMAMFLLAEAVFFFLLILAFVYFRETSAEPAARTLNLKIAAFSTAFLLASAFSMWRAARSANGARLWLGITILLGAAFLAGQSSQLLHLIDSGITMSQGLFGTTFFTLTGLHGLHILIGLIVLATVLSFTASEQQSAAVQTVALYWYFLDLVWLTIFVVAYLWTFL
jgi:cytochrome c oxidase subunit III